MGMAASQARLLSITTRLTNNEFRAQMTANARVRLADKTQVASEEYMKALEATKLQYSYYDANGNKSQETLTAGVLNFYQPLKNQYALVNNAGQILVRPEDAATFTEAKNRDEFLVLNDCAEIVQKDVLNPAYPKWEKRVPDVNDPKYWTETVSMTSELYDKFKTASSSCYSSAMGTRDVCYLHVLAHLLDYVHQDASPYFNQATYPKNYNTTVNGLSISIDSGMITGAGMHNATNSEMISEVSDALSNGYNDETMMAPDLNDATVYQNNGDGTYTVETDDGPVTYYTFNTGNAQADLLLSNYKADGTLKTLKEKTIDLYYVIENYSGMGLDYDMLKNALKNYQVDMAAALKEREFDQAKYDADYQTWEQEEPEEYIQVDEVEITDPDKAEWYTNLWHRMNGATADEVVVLGDPNDPKNNVRPVDGEYYHKSEPEKLSFVVLEDSLMNSPEWLQYALETGAVTMEQAKFEANAETTVGLETYKWSAVSWSSTADISEVDDQIAITKAEVIYNKKLAEIQAEDKSLENDIKKLDTEHNALQTEYDSIKGVMDKNMERSFKAFS